MTAFDWIILSAVLTVLSPIWLYVVAKLVTAGYYRGKQFTENHQKRENERHGTRDRS